MSTRRSAPSDVEVHRAFVALAEAKSGADAIRVFDSNPHIRGASFVAAVWYRAASAGLGAGPNWDGETLDRLTRALYSALVKESAKCSPQVLVAAAAACSLHSPRLPPGRLDRHADLISARVSQRSAEFDLGQLASVSQSLSVVEPSSLHRQGALTRKALRLLAASLHSRCSSLSDRGLVDAAHALAEALKASPPMASPGETAVARLRVSLAAAVAGRGLACPPSVMAVVAPVAIPAASCVNDQASEAARLAKWIAAALVTAPGPEAHAAALARAVDATVAASAARGEEDSPGGGSTLWDAGAALSCIRAPSAPAARQRADAEGSAEVGRPEEDAAWALDEEAAYMAVSGLLAADARPERDGSSPPAALLGGLRSSLRVAGTPSSWRGSAGKWLPELRLERHGGGHLRSSEEATIVAVPPTGLAWAPAGDAEPWGKPVVPDCDAAALIVALERAGSRPVVVEPGGTQKDIKEGLIAAWSERS
ncbi:hypothetical protein FNF29_00130 [Cafeteria roenbergensis]|uniref:Uncharacterized protein n=1 Tax=Cafeteria roenbergensis TaxID=33653 RepID=A0A5A8CYF3_CAFRO|nr:hypothetical protein FNF29_00130 [Cafeteria roenbergensis]|eukprot:KAA0157554.1 hypothetical protein FNF29_00130 [Cafeteria roenbergensis]